MKRKTMLICAAALSCLALSSVALASQVGNGPASLIKGAAEAFKVELSSAKNRFYTGTGTSSDGQANLKTNLGNAIRFAHSKAKSSTGWQSFGKDGYFYNVDAINGMKSIKVSFVSSGASFQILYSGDEKLDRSKEFVASIDEVTTFDFEERTPNYFEILNTGDSDLNIASIEIEYSCSNGYLTLSVASEDETKGTVTGGETLLEGDKATLTADPAEGYAFEGWYIGDSLISKDSTYVYTMSGADTSIVAKFADKAEEEARRKALGIDPVIDSENGTLTYGLYPQKWESDTDIVEALNVLTEASANGWYFYDGKYYAKKSADPCNLNNKESYFDDGTEIVSGNTYWFECEPITWKILSSESGEYSLVSTVLLDAHRYASSSNKYEDSEIRSWLNADFYGSAFSLGNSLIQTTVVDNSISTTDSESDSSTQVGDPTNDNVYLLSYQDYKNTAYFSDPTERPCKTTEWARASGADYERNSSSAYFQNGYYWTRSPASNDNCYSWYVGHNGTLYNYWARRSSYSVRPAITIKIS